MEKTAEQTYLFTLIGSHSGEYVVCAVSEKDVGVDLERDPTGESPPGAHADGAEAAVAGKSAKPERDEGFLRLWTLKESWIKCRGGRLIGSIVM